MPRDKTAAAPQAKTWGGKALGAGDRVEGKVGAFPSPKAIVVSYNALIDRAIEGDWHKDPAFFAHMDACSKKVGVLEQAFVDYAPKMSLGQSLAGLQKLVTKVRDDNSARKPQKPLSAIIEALAAYGQEEGGKKASKGEAAAKAAEVAAKAAAEAAEAAAARAAEAEALLITGMLDMTLGLFKGNQAALIKALALPPPRVDSMAALALRLAALGKEEAKRELAEASATLARPSRKLRGGGSRSREEEDSEEEEEEEEDRGGRKGQSSLLKVVKAAVAVRAGLITEPSEEQAQLLDALNNGVRAFLEQYASKAEVSLVGTMRINSLEDIKPILPRAVIKHYPASTGAAVMLYDVSMLRVEETSEAHSALSTWAMEGDLLVDLAGLLVVDVVRSVVFELWESGLSPFISLQAWGELMDPSASSPASRAAARLPFDAGSAMSLMHKLCLKVAELESKARSGMSLSSGGVGHGAHSVLARIILRETGDLAADAACYSGPAQLRGPSGRARKGSPTAAPYTFLLWKLLCFLASGVAVLQLSERAGQAFAGAGVLTYAQGGQTPTALLPEAAGGGRKRGKVGADERDKSRRKQERKQLRAEGGTRAPVSTGSVSDSASDEDAPPQPRGTGSGGVKERTGYPLWHFLKPQFASVASYVRRDMEYRCCYCGSAECNLGRACPPGYPKQDLQRRDKSYDPQFQSRDTLIKMYQAMKPAHRRL
jgi:hypothetical protein